MNRRRSRWNIWKRLGALADVTGEPLPFKGEDFAHTDVEVA